MSKRGCSDEGVNCLAEPQAVVLGKHGLRNFIPPDILNSTLPPGKEKTGPKKAASKNAFHPTSSPTRASGVGKALAHGSNVFRLKRNARPHRPRTQQPHRPIRHGGWFFTSRKDHEHVAACAVLAAPRASARADRERSGPGTWSLPPC